MNEEIKYCKCGCGQIVNNKFISGHNSKGTRQSDKTRQKKSAAMKGEKHPNFMKKLSAETRLKMSVAHSGKRHHLWGKHHTDESKEKMSLSHIGYKHSDISREKMSKSRTGKNLSDKHKKKLSESLRGHIVSDKTKIKISVANKGRFIGNKSSNYGKHFSHTRETKRKMSESKKGSKNYMYGKHHSEETRGKISLNHADLSGMKCPMWKGGISFLPYSPEFNKTLKRKIRERDNFTCQHPDCSIQKNSIPVHHIDYDKKNNLDDNLICLCESHHSQTTSGDRPYWIIFYQTIMKFKT